VTTIEPAAAFYVAEDYHQDYYARNPDQGYCVAVVGPKVKKFKALFADKLKSEQ
jgi:peptide-methionine (S)-S-oxide reductase